MPQYRGYQIRLMPADGHKRVEINPIYRICRSYDARFSRSNLALMARC